MGSDLKGIKTIRDFELKDKIVFLRLDLNVPLEGGKITDETRITASLPTIKYALEKGAKLVMASHLGRPKAAGDKKYSMEPVADRLSELLGKEVILVEEPKSDAVKALVKGAAKNQIVLLENLRYEPGETENAEDFAQAMASYTEIYINDAFGASHRAHASIDALPRLVKNKGIGFLIEKEIQMLNQLLENPKRPYLAILGGAKVSDKIDVIMKLMDVVDGFIIGGAMAYTFEKAKGMAVGRSLVEADKISFAKDMMRRIEARDKTLLLPVDHVVTTDIASKKTTETSGPAIEYFLSAGALKGVLAVESKPLVSVDFNGNPYSSIIDLPCTMVSGTRTAKVFSWYDNETGFSNRMVDLAKYMAAKGL